MNLNDRVRVTLTEAGRAVLQERVSAQHYPPSAGDVYGHLVRDLESGAPLRELFYWFGHVMFNGSSRMPFVSNEIEICEP